jgi:hypothetical protein
MTDPRRDPGPPPPDDQSLQDFEDVERITRAFVYWSKWALIVGLPIWLVLLVVVPRSGLGLMASLGLSTLLAAGAVLLAERQWGRGPAPAGGEQGPVPRRRRERRPMSPLRAVVLTLASVVLVIYVIFILVMIVRGG